MRGPDAGGVGDTVMMARFPHPRPFSNGRGGAQTADDTQPRVVGALAERAGRGHRPRLQGCAPSASGRSGDENEMNESGVWQWAKDRDAHAAALARQEIAIKARRRLRGRTMRSRRAPRSRAIMSKARDDKSGDADHIDFGRYEKLLRRFI